MAKAERIKSLKVVGNGNIGIPCMAGQLVMFYRKMWMTTIYQSYMG